MGRSARTKTEHGHSAEEGRLTLISPAERAFAIGLTIAVNLGLVAMLTLLPSSGQPVLPVAQQLAVTQIASRRAPPPPPPPPPIEPPAKTDRAAQRPAPGPPAAVIRQETPAATIQPVIQLARPSDLPPGTGEAGSGANGTAGDGLETAGGKAAVLTTAQWQSQPQPGDFRISRTNARRGGWGEIACLTAPGFRVTRCRLLAEFPDRSGFGRAMVAASRSLRVIPPEVDGKPAIGVWVSIHLDFQPEASG